MNYVLDENCAIKKEVRPDKLLTALEFMYKYTREIYPNGIPDDKLMNLAKKEDYVIITRDKGLVIRANKIQMDIIYIGNDGTSTKKEEFWFFISHKVKLKMSRATLNAKIRKKLEWCSDFDDYSKIMVIG